MTRISPVRASARGYMLIEAAEHLRMEVCDNAIEREEANKIADRLEREAHKWFARGLDVGEDYDACCSAEIAAAA